MKQKRQKAIIYRKAQYAGKQGNLQKQLALALHQFKQAGDRRHEQ